MGMGMGMDMGLGQGMLMNQVCAPVAPSQGKGCGSRPAREGDWICSQCDNMNFADRPFCNMRKCGAARVLPEWICAACGNSNFPDRLHCNMRKCGQVRTDLHQKAVEVLLAKGGVPKGKGKGGMPDMGMGGMPGIMGVA